jgi:hypothetical protein
MLGRFVGALFLATVLLAGWRLTASLTVGRRRVASAGVAVAYVFVYMLPALDEAGRAFVEATRNLGLPLPAALFCFAMALHFLGIAGDLFKEHGALYLNPAGTSWRRRCSPAG